MKAMKISLALAALMIFAARAEAGLITERFTFEELSKHGGTVSGTFTYNPSTTPVKGAYALTSFTAIDSAIPFPYSLFTPTASNLSGLSFTPATGLAGSVTASDFLLVFGEVAHGTYSSKTNSMTFTSVAVFPFATDTVSGPIAYAAAPEPATLVSCGTAALLGGGFYGWRRRKARVAA